MGKKITHDEYIQRVAEVNSNIEVIGEYVNSETNILHRCKIDGYEWMAKPLHILRNHGCPACAGQKKKTQKEYILEVVKINPNIEVVGEYINAHTKILHKCKIDGFEWYTSPHNILRGQGCPKCAGKIRKTHEQYVKEVAETNPNIKIIGTYVNIHTNILHRCKIDGYEWYAKPNNILHGTNCPVCVGCAIGNYPEYKNSIWASEYVDYFSKYLTDEQMKSYTPHSNAKINISCPDCGKPKLISLFRLLKEGFGCICGDGRSYPNKFMYAFLTELKVEHELEYSPDWAGNFKYDIYIPSLNCIIENHGAQHYKGGFEYAGGKTLEEEQENDKYKESIAKNNGIAHYVVINCKVSDASWIKDSILKSHLPILLSFNEKSVNWNKCDKFATSNLVKEASNLWNNGLTTKDIANNLGVGQSTAARYLKKGVKFGWCDYSKQKSMERRNSGVINLSTKKVYTFLKVAAENNNISTRTMTEYCKKHNGFMYYNEYIALQNEKVGEKSERF